MMIRFALALLLSLPAAAFTQADMLARLQAQELSPESLGPRREWYSQRMHFTLLPQEEQGVSRLLILILSEDGRKMGRLVVALREGQVERVEEASLPGDYVLLRPNKFLLKRQLETVSWKFEGGEFRGLDIEYGIGTLAGLGYDAAGRLKTVSVCPSRGRSVMQKQQLEPLPPLELDEEEAQPPLLDMSGVDGSLSAEDEEKPAPPAR